MNDQQDNQISAEEEELAKVLDDINQQVDSQTKDLNEEPKTPIDQTTEDVDDSETTSSFEPASQFTSLDQQFDQDAAGETQSALEEPISYNITDRSENESNSELADIKKSALEDLRPLVDKLNLADEEKFEVQLLLIRSTDDQTLLDSAYKSAREIKNEEKRAQALLDIIKEIDYFSSKK